MATFTYGAWSRYDDGTWKNNTTGAIATPEQVPVLENWSGWNKTAENQTLADQHFAQQQQATEGALASVPQTGATFTYGAWSRYDDGTWKNNTTGATATPDQIPVLENWSGYNKTADNQSLADQHFAQQQEAITGALSAPQVTGSAPWEGITLQPNPFTAAPLPWQPGQALSGAEIDPSQMRDPAAYIASLMQPQTNIIDENNNTATTPAHTFDPTTGVLMAPPSRDPMYSSDSGLPEYGAAQPYFVKLANSNAGVITKDGRVVDTGRTFNDVQTNGGLMETIRELGPMLMAAAGPVLGPYGFGVTGAGGSLTTALGSELGASLAAQAAAQTLITGGINPTSLAVTAALSQIPGGGDMAAFGTGSDTLTGGIGNDTVGALSDFAGSDAIETISNAIDITGAATATEAANILGFQTTEAMLASINPAFVTADALANIDRDDTNTQPGALPPDDPLVEQDMGNPPVSQSDIDANRAAAAAAVAATGASSAGGLPPDDPLAEQDVGNPPVSQADIDANRAAAAAAVAAAAPGALPPDDPLAEQDMGNPPVSQEDIEANRKAAAAAVAAAAAASSDDNVTPPPDDSSLGDPLDVADDNITPPPDDPSLGDPPDGSDPGFVDYIKKLGTGALAALGFMKDGKIDWGKALATGGLLAGLYQGSKPTTTSVNKELPEWYTRGSQEALALAKQYADKGFEPYTGETIAPLSANENAAIEMAKNAAGVWEPVAKQGADLVAKGALPVSRDDIQGYVNPALAGIGTNQVASMYDEAGNLIRAGTSAITQDDLSRLMNPYIELAYAPAKRQLERDTAAKQAIARASAVSRGAFGTDRQAIQDSLLNEAGLTALGDLYGTSYKTAFDEATKLATGEKDRSLTGGNTMYGAANNLGSLTNTAWKNATDTATGNLDRMIEGGGALSDIATEGSALTDADIKRLGATGALDRSVRQAKNDFDYGQYQDRLKFPSTAIGNYATALRGVPGNTTTTTTAPPNFFGEAIGALGAWNNWFNTPEKK